MTESAAQTPDRAPAGWHPDPYGGQRLRYWDGTYWTVHTAPVGGPEPEAPADRASYGQRAGALLLDLALWGVLILIGIVPIAIGGVAGVVIGIVILSLAVLVYPFLYAPLLMLRDGAHGQTLGKQAVGIRVVMGGGGRIDAGTAFLRVSVIQVLGFWLSGGLLTLLDYLWPLGEQNERALHDMWTKTWVVRDEPDAVSGAEPTRSGDAPAG